MKNLHLTIFAAAVLAQLGAPIWQIAAHENVLKNGTLIRLKCAAPDPYDPLRGRYLAVRPAESSTKTATSLRPGVTAFASFKTDADGLSHIASLTPERPTVEPFLRVKTNYSFSGETQIEWPFERFYLNEELAPEADKWFAANLRTDSGVIAEVRVLNGRAVLFDLTVNGKSVREVVKGSK